MCRFLLYKGLHPEKDAVLIEDLIVKPAHSIIRQSFNSTERCAVSQLMCC